MNGASDPETASHDIATADSAYLLECRAAWLALGGSRDAMALAIERELRARGEIVPGEPDEWAERYARRLEYEARIRAGAETRYRPCSGQSRGSRRWSVCDELIPHWRPEDSRGRIRLFASFEAAQREADKFNAAPLVLPA